MNRQQIIQLTLDKIGISRKTKGYAYLVDTIGMYIELRDGYTFYLFNSMTIQVASKYGVKCATVYRNMDSVVRKAWYEDGNKDVLMQIFKVMPYKPSTSDFASCIADFIRNNYKEIKNNTFKWEDEQNEK